MLAVHIESFYVSLRLLRVENHCWLRLQLLLVLLDRVKRRVVDDVAASEVWLDLLLL